MKTRKQYLNKDWIYQDENCTNVDLPHSNQLYPYNYLQNHNYQKKVSYLRTFNVDTLECDVYLVFESVLHQADVYVNGSFYKRLVGGYMQHEIHLVDLEVENHLEVVVDAHESLMIPPFGGVIDYLTYGGINGQVYLEYRPKKRLSHTWFYMEDGKGYVCGELVGLDHAILQMNIQDKKYEVGIQKQFKVYLDVQGLALWSIEDPVCHQLTLSLYDESEYVYSEVLTIGIRTAVFKDDGFYLNGNKIKLIGLNRHQSYPSVGYAVSSSLQVDDVYNLKRLGVNIVRTSHYPQSKAFIEACDQLGILVFTEIVGWQHISSDDGWRQQVLVNTEMMVLQYRNHPSIVVWGVRINESMDDDVLYEETNCIARNLDPSRQTTGVRFIKNSNLLEDIYSYNDFSHTGNNSGIENPSKVMKKHVPYIISEHSGHMFPTKRYDDESHRLEHALRHARVLSDALMNERVSAVIGWVMNDYHTHQDFGSGDMICYHGVQDIFRIPKLAAYVYMSQQDTTPILKVSSSMNIGEYPASSLYPLVVFTNCDSVRLFKNGTYIQTFYPSKDYPGLKHPPIFIDDFFGNQLVDLEGYSKKDADQIKEVLLAVYRYGQNNLPIKQKLIMGTLLVRKVITFEKGYELYAKYIGNWGDHAKKYDFVGYKNKQEVIQQCVEPVKQKYLKANLTHHPLVEVNTYDMALLQITAVDQNDLLLDYAFDVVEIICKDGIHVVGDTTVSLIGGSVGVLICSEHQAIDSEIIIKSSTFDTVTVKVKVEIHDTNKR